MIVRFKGCCDPPVRPAAQNFTALIRRSIELARAKQPIRSRVCAICGKPERVGGKSTGGMSCYTLFLSFFNIAGDYAHDKCIIRARNKWRKQHP